MMYGELSQEQRNIRQKEWEKVLNTFCPSYIVIDEETGEEEDYGKPCDQGCPCDRCHYDWDLQLKYVKRLHELGEQLLDDEIEKYGEYL